MPATSLQDVRAQVEAGAFALDADMQMAVIGRIDDLITTVTAANRALSKVPHADVGTAAARMAHVFYISGHGWRRYLAESSPQASAVGDAIREAITASTAVLAAQLGRLIAARPAGPVSRRSGALFGLPCSACGIDAVTLTRASTSPAAAEQLVVSSLSPVTVFRPVAGSRMHDLLSLVDAGDAAAVVTYLRETQPAGCDAYCEPCGRVYCREHYAIEAQWSGSWHEATFVTCPLGHQHEVD